MVGRFRKFFFGTSKAYHVSAGTETRDGKLRGKRWFELLDIWFERGSV